MPFFIAILVLQRSLPNLEESHCHTRSDLSELNAASLFNLKGWVTVVTGGGTGLGLITAKSLAANGAKVYVTGRRADKLKDAEMTDSASGGSIVGLQMDCTDKQSIQQGIKAISEKEKFVNLLVSKLPLEACLMCFS